MSAEEEFDSSLLDDLDSFIEEGSHNTNSENVDSDIDLPASASPLREEAALLPLSTHDQAERRQAPSSSAVSQGGEAGRAATSAMDVEDGILLDSSGGTDSPADSIDMPSLSSSTDAQPVYAPSAVPVETSEAPPFHADATNDLVQSVRHSPTEQQEDFPSHLQAEPASEASEAVREKTQTSTESGHNTSSSSSTSYLENATEVHLAEKEAPSLSETVENQHLVPLSVEVAQNEEQLVAAHVEEPPQSLLSPGSESTGTPDSEAVVPMNAKPAMPAFSFQAPPPLETLPTSPTNASSASQSSGVADAVIDASLPSLHREDECDEPVDASRPTSPSAPAPAPASISALPYDDRESKPHAAAEEEEAPVVPALTSEPTTAVEETEEAPPFVESTRPLPEGQTTTDLIHPPPPFVAQSDATAAVAAETPHDLSPPEEKEAKESMGGAAPAVDGEDSFPPVIDFKEVEQEIAPTPVSAPVAVPKNVLPPPPVQEVRVDITDATPSSPPPPSLREAHVSPSHAPAHSKDKDADAAVKPTRRGSALQEEEEILDALLAAVDDPQASRSAASDEGAPDAGESSGAHLIRAVIEQAEVLATSSVISSSKRKGECVLHFHRSNPLNKELQALGGFEGWPTCAAVASHVSLTHPNEKATGTKGVAVVVGTTLGVIAVFSQTFRVVGKCGSVDADGVQTWGAVRSLSLSDDGETLLAGYDKGVLVLWSMTQLTAIRTVRDEFDTSVEKVLHLPLEPYKAIAMEASGSVKLLQFTRIVNKAVVRTSSVVEAATGNATRDTAVCPFPSSIYEHGREHASGGSATKAISVAETKELTLYAPQNRQARVEDTHLVATVCSDAIELYSVETGLASKIVCIARRGHTPQPGHSSERVAFSITENPVGRQIRLCASVAKRIEIYLLHVNGGGDTISGVMEPMYAVELAAPARALCAIAAGCILALDGMENGVTVVDPSVGQKVERHTLASIEMATPSAHQDAEKLYYGTLVSNLNECFILGRQEAFSCCLLSWKARLDGLILRKKYQAALRLMEQVHGEAATAVVGLSDDTTVHRQAFQEYVQYTCMAFVKSALAAKDTSATCYRKLYEALVFIIPFCTKLETLDVFFEHIMKYLHEQNCINYGLYALERCMLQNTLPALPESYAYAFFHFFSDANALRRVEAHLYGSVGQQAKEREGQILEQNAEGGKSTTDAQTLRVAQLPPGSDGVARAEAALMHLSDGIELLLDFAERNGLLLLKLSLLSLRRRRVDEALYFIVEEAMKVTPAPPTSDSRPRANAREYAVLFVEKTLQGYTLIESQEIPLDFRVRFKRTLWLTLGDGKTLAQVVACDPPRVVDALLRSMGSMNSAWSPFEEESCPLPCCVNYVFATLTATSQGANTITGNSRILLNYDVPPCLLPPVAQQVSAEDGGHTRPFHFAPVEVAQEGRFPYLVVRHFLEGLIKLVWSQEEEMGLAFAGIDWRYFATACVDHYLYLCQNAASRDERHTLEVDLSRFLMHVTEVVDPALLRGYKEEFLQCGMFRCLAALYSVQGSFGEAIDCFLSKENNQHNATLAAGVFPMLRSEALHISALEKRTKRREEKQQVRERLSDLRRAVVERVPQLVQVDAAELAQFVFDFLPSKHKDVINLLKCSSKVFLKYIEELIAKEDVQVLSDTNLQNKYIELLAAEQPAMVYTHLKKNGHLVSYDVQVALRAVQSSNIADATVFLLTKTLSYDEAVRVFIQYCYDALRAVRHEVFDLGMAVAPPTTTIPLESHKDKDTASESKSPSSHASSLQALDHVVEVGIEFCGAVRPQGEAGKYWFVLLDCFGLPRQVVSRWVRKTPTERSTRGAASPSNSVASPTPAAMTSAADELQEVFRNLLTDPFRAQKVPAQGEVQAPSGPVSASDMKKLEQLLAIYTTYTSNIVGELVKVMDPSVVVSKVLREDAEEDLEPLRDILVDIMSTLRFDLQARKLCMTCAEDDVMQLSKELYAHITRGITPQSDCCGLCGGHLGDPPRRSGGVQDSASSTTAVCAFACGHVYHDACRLAWMGKDALCYQCYLQRAGEADGGTGIMTAASSAIPFGETPRWSAPGEAGDSKTSHLSSNNNSNFVVAAETGRAPTAAMHRRLRQTRAKLDRTSGSFYDVLKGFLDPSVTGATPVLSLVSAKVNLVLAPPPRMPVHVGPSAEENEEVSPLDLTKAEAIQQCLTEEEVQELLGS